MEKQNWFRTYIFIWAGQFVSLLTSSAVNFAVIIWLSLHHNSAEVLAFAGISGLLPQALIGPFAGVFIDRWDRKKVMIYADAFIAICTVIMALGFQEEGVNLWLVYILLACRSVGSAFHSPAMQAIAPLIVPEDKLLRVSGINQMLQSVSSVAGPALGTLAIAYLPIAKVLYLDVIGAAMAIISLLFISIPHLRTASKLTTGMVWQDLKGGMRAIYRHKSILALFIYAMIATFCIMPVAMIFPLLTINHFGGKEFEMSIIEIIWGVGMLVGGAIISILKINIRKVVLINMMYVILGLSFLLSGLISPQLFSIFVILTGLGGVSMAIFSAAFMTIIQEEIVPELLGRVFSLYFSIAIIPSVIGLLFTGHIADAIGVATTFVISGVLVILVGLLSSLTPAVMSLGKEKEGATIPPQPPA